MYTLDEAKLYNKEERMVKKKKHSDKKYCTICSSKEALREFKAHYICNQCVDDVQASQDEEKEQD